MIPRPEPSEYAPYYGRYIDQVPSGDVLRLMSEQIAETKRLLSSVPPEREGFRYAPGKWSIREVVGHVTDTERIFAYRALRIARGDRTPLPGFEQDDFVRGANFERRTLAALTDELGHVRQATLDLFAGLDEEALARRGVASTVEMSARAIAYIIAGHERHHVEGLRRRYL